MQNKLTRGKFTVGLSCKIGSSRLFIIYIQVLLLVKLLVGLHVLGTLLPVSYFSKTFEIGSVHQGSSHRYRPSNVRIL